MRDCMLFHLVWRLAAAVCLAVLTAQHFGTFAAITAVLVLFTLAPEKTFK